MIGGFHLLKVLGDEDEVDTAEAQLSDAEEDVRDYPGRPGTPPEGPVAGGEEAGVGHLAVGEVGRPGPGTELLGVRDQEVHVVDTGNAHQHQASHCLISNPGFLI